MEIQLKKNELVSWLKTIAGATILSISFVGQIEKLETNITSPITLAAAFEQKVDFFNDGPYLIKYEKTEKNADTDKDIPYSNFAMAITFKAEIKNHPGIFIGGYDALIREISSFEYLANIGTGPAGPQGHFLILVPQEPVDIAKLEEILKKYSVVYSFPDSNGTLNLGNVKMGRGIVS